MTPPAQQAFDAELLRALPRTCVLAGSAAEGIICNNTEISRRDMRGLPYAHAASVMLVPRGSGVTVSAGVLDSDPWADQDGVGGNDIGSDCEGLKRRFFTTGFTAAIVSDHETLGGMIDWFNHSVGMAGVQAGCHVAGAITGAQGRRPLLYRDGGSIVRCEGVVLLNIRPDPARVCFRSSGHVGNALSAGEFGRIHNAELRDGGVNGGVSACL